MSPGSGWKRSRGHGRDAAGRMTSWRRRHTTWAPSARRDWSASRRSSPTTGPRGGGCGAGPPGAGGARRPARSARGPRLRCRGQRPGPAGAILPRGLADPAGTRDGGDPGRTGRGRGPGSRPARGSGPRKRRGPPGVESKEGTRGGRPVSKGVGGGTRVAVAPAPGGLASSGNWAGPGRCAPQRSPGRASRPSTNSTGRSGSATTSPNPTRTSSPSGSTGPTSASTGHRTSH